MYTGGSERLQAVARQNVATVPVLTHTNLVTAVTTDLSDYFVDGTITDDATSNVRRSLSLTLAGVQSVFDTLNIPGGEITVVQRFVYPDQSTDDVPHGVYIVDQQQLDYAPSGQITMTCPDRWLKVQRNKFGLSRASVPTNTASAEIKRLVEGAWPGSTYPFPGWSVLDESALTQVGSLMWDDGDREGAILSLCQANSLEVFFDRTGMAVLRKVPVLTPTSVPVWNVDSGASGVMTAATRSQDWSNTRNVIIVSTSATDVVFDPVECKDTTFGDPLDVTGTLGYVPEEWSSPALRNSDQAKAAGLTRLRKRLGSAYTVSLSAVQNPCLDAEDVIGIQYPQVDPNTGPLTDVQILDSVTHPLSTTGTQDMQTRSTRPTTDGSP